LVIYIKIFNGIVVELSWIAIVRCVRLLIQLFNFFIDKIIGIQKNIKNILSFTSKTVYVVIIFF